MELGTDHPGDMDVIAKWVKPNIAVFSAFGDVPVHVEHFDEPEDLIKEDAKMLKYMKKGGAVILNADDPHVLKLKSKSKSQVYTVGLNQKADIQATNIKIKYSDFAGLKQPSGMTFKIEYKGHTVPVSINGVIGKQYVYPILSAIAIGQHFNIPSVELIPNISKYEPSPGRMRIIQGINNSTILDDTYNSSPVAVKKAIEGLSMIETAGRKIAVLGDMLELGRYSVSEHKKVGKLVYENKINLLLTVGPRARDIAKMALEEGMKEESVYAFDHVSEIADGIHELVKEGDIILFKASQGIRLEKAVEMVMEHPEDKKNLLARQDDGWSRR